MTRSDPHDLARLTGALLSAARAAGATEADALAVSGESLSVEVRGGALEQAGRAEGVEIGLRVIVGGRQACVSASERSDRTIREMAERAVAMAREAPVDDNVGLADPAQLARDRDAAALELDDGAPAPEPPALLDMALRAEAAARAVEGISMVESAGASAMHRRMWLAGTNGFSGGYDRSSHGLSAVAITGEGLGMERDWAGEARVWAEDLPSPEEIGRLAGARTVARKGARKPPTGAFPILYDERVAGSLLSHLLSAVNGSVVARGSSWLRGDMGQPVLPPGFDLSENPRQPRHPASRPFDAEGLATAPRMIVADGVLQGWTLDLATARKLGMASTGNAMRGTSSPPSPGITNVALTAGKASPEDLIRGMGQGLVVTSMLGASINATTGDYSRGAAGFWVENGQIAYPVNECTIAGNLREMLMRITAADDLPDWRSLRVPSLLVEGMTVAGS
ncbi:MULTISPECIES: TldD/PmbA family protein [unclassified Paracoccus (in: a-proteobacteria)]|uniref:TldD/PmbA family protein n=1 Tax=unclassified Paracoccus (in: a-proteobacteria) TaxID=2688777 RepID=UPI0016006FD7|nr:MULTISPECIES: TldD/PmbA family protein [unclassified Paracoccus (in: a-proteobacteria)]MBB1490263.1 TldD/PmbA family protein [Paracoccus sp. MC1854]MBB1498525.1 TldD/PmbA family protein [Paracoccus sp. MC1862]QQO43873.1 TldD/PmbA family protein [Paracoccus sp. MC1862]